MSNELDLATETIDNGLFIEASAGTGKTYSIAALVTRLLALDGNLRISQILVTTFTRYAAAELQNRVRRRLVSTAAALRSGTADESDKVLTLLLDGDDDERAERARRLERAVGEYDSATIATIHAICSKVLALAGEGRGGIGQDDRARIIAEVVNDLLVSEANIEPTLDEAAITSVVKAALSEPLTKLWFDHGGRTDAEVELLERVVELVGKAVERVNHASGDTPSFDDLIRRAREILADPVYATVVSEFRTRYRFVIVDEAQDTDAQQWAIFRSVFPMANVAHGGSLVAVGDPKQSIYRFRGADVDSYRAERVQGRVSTLRQNHRSDTAVLDGLNALFRGAMFGAGISYVEVRGTGKATAVSGVAPVEVVNLGKVTNQDGLIPAVARRVSSLLSGNVRLGDDSVAPGDIVVLVKSGSVGMQVERALRRLNIPAVSTGTASVMSGETAQHWRVLLRALERISDAGRVRHLLGTPIFGVPLTSPELLDNQYISTVQDRLATWTAALRTGGIAALATVLMSNSAVLQSISRGVQGERRLTDFSHLTDLLHAETGGRGCTPTEALEAYGRLSLLDKTSETVSRRVESDAKAVQIMTIHVAKGLEFPVVVVADLWKPEIPSNVDSPPVFVLPSADNSGAACRVIDVGWAVGLPAASGETRQLEEALEEYARLLYVAATRAKHHVSLMWGQGDKLSIIDRTMNDKALAGGDPAVKVVPVADLPDASDFAASSSGGTAGEVEAAALPDPIRQTYQRTSFTGILDKRARGINGGRFAADHRGGTDEGEGFAQGRSPYAAAGLSLGAKTMPLATVPGGMQVGKVLHSVYEDVDLDAVDLRAEVERAVDTFVVGRALLARRQDLVDGITLSLSTPLGGPLGQRTLCDVGSANRLAELGFEMSLAHASRNVSVRQIGRVLREMVAADDVLVPYAEMLDHVSFEIPLAGLINGSIDALLRVTEDDGSTRLFVADYKTNRLDEDGDETFISAYTAARMLREMVHHHYPLQALIYGTAVHRWVRWRMPEIDADAAVGGMAYLFVRGMVGVDTPSAADGSRSGVFTWTAPRGLWARLSDVMAGSAA